MKKVLCLTLLVLMVFSFTGNAFAVYTRPGSVGVTPENIAYAEKVYSSLQWDTSQASTASKIVLSLPKLDGYLWVVNKDSGNYVGINLYTTQVYVGEGGTTVDLSMPTSKGLGVYISLATKGTLYGVAEEAYVYFPDKGVQYIPPEDRISVSIDEQGNINQYYNNDNQPISANDPRITNPFVNSYSIFSDFNSSHWAYNVIYKLTQLGYIKGYPDGTFRPSGNITWAEFSAIMSHLLENKYSAGSKYDNSKTFSDLSSSHWSYGVATKMLSYMSADDAYRIFGRSFLPDQKITREEVVAVIHATLKDSGKLANGSESVSFSDMSSARFTDSIEYCVKRGFIKGYPDGTFKPAGNITRAEIAAILVKVVEAIK